MLDERQRFISTWDESLVAVAAAHASAADQSGAMPAARARWVVAELNVAGRRDLVHALYRLVTGGAGHTAVDVNAGGLVEVVEDAAAEGRLLFVQQDGTGGNAEAAAPISDFRETPHEKLARQAMNSRPEILFEGRRYRLMAFSRFRAASPTNVRVVPFEEAQGVIQRIGARTTRTPQERALWADVAENLSTNGRPGGLVLMHDRPSGKWEQSPVQEAPVTPSQMKAQIAPTDWIQIDVTYDDGTPYDGACTVLLPDGRSIQGTPDENGTLRFDGIDPGSCTVSFPDLDASSVAAA